MGILEIYFISLSFLSPYPLYLHTISSSVIAVGCLSFRIATPI
ncbi:MAG: hypothetical protein QME07_00695 [bacterium]|nr:hypothetical protein [bacterium]